MLRQSSSSSGAKQRCRHCACAADARTGVACLCLGCAITKLSRDHFLEGANYDTSQRTDCWDGSGVCAHQIAAPIGEDRTLRLASLNHAMLHAEHEQWRQYQAVKSAIASAPTPQQQIGAVVPFVNPATQSGFLYNPKYGVVPAAQDVPPEPLSDAELAAQLRSAGVERRMVHPGAKGLLASLFDPFLSEIAPSPVPRLPLAFKPMLLQRGQIERMMALPHGFPVFVRWPMFGAAIATHYMLISRSNPPGTGLPFSALLGAPSTLHFAVQKFSPYGITPGEPFALGQWLVPAANCVRLDLAIAQLLPAENIAVMDDKYGRAFSVSFTDMMSSTRPEYDIARRALYVQYPTIAGPQLATRLVREVPADMAPSTVVIPQVLREAPASLVEVQPGERVPSAAAAEPATETETVTGTAE